MNLQNRKFKSLFLLAIFIIPILSMGISNAQDIKVAFDETGSFEKRFTIYNTGPLGGTSFASVLEANGFDVIRYTDSPITYDKIKDFNVLIIMAPGRNYTSTEIESIKRFVESGGGLFLVGDSWGIEDGGINYSYNKIAQAFGLSYQPYEIVADSVNYIASPSRVKVSDIRNSTLTTELSEFNYFRGTYLQNIGSSVVVAYSGPDSWADQAYTTSSGYSNINEIKENNETKGPFPLWSSLEYGQGKVVFFGAAGTLCNSWLYRSNGWKVGLNSVYWLADQPIPSNYKKAGLISLTLADLETKIAITIIMAIIIVAGLFLVVRRTKKQEASQTLKTIKTWKFNLLAILNGVFMALGALFFILIGYFTLDISSPIYDPYLGYILIPIGIIFLMIYGGIIYNLLIRQRLNSTYNYCLMALLIFFAVFTIILGDLFGFFMMEIFTLGSLFLLIPLIINWISIRQHTQDLIIEGKEFNRLQRISERSLPYELQSLYTEPSFVGEGGFGKVFKAKRKDDMEVAIKIPKSFDKRSEKIFVSEVSNWSQLNHPHIVKLFGFKILPIPYLEMEYCEESLPHKKQPNEVAVAIIYEIAQALGYAHQKNIIHGDIKTSNIMIKKGVYKISDWGLSKVTTDGSVTLSGATPQYAAPEQISREFGRSDERTDIYQLGTVFYELLTGKVPFEGEMSEIYGSILNTQPTLPSEINPESAALEPIVMKCLSKVKDERYSSMSELQKDLEEYYTPISMDETIVLKEEPENGRS